MTTFYERDSSFFTVHFEDDIQERAINAEDVMSLTVEEEFEERVTRGSLQLLDPNHAYARIVRVGSPLMISWGYKRPDASLFMSPDALTSSIDRRGLKAFILNPSGSAGSNGVHVFSANFMASELRGEFNSTIYDVGTKASVVAQVLARMGAINVHVDFARGQDVVTGDKALRQYERDFSFLTRYAREWGAMFRIGYASDGTVVAMFVDPHKVAASPIAALIGGGSGSTVELNWKYGVRPNVINYSWQNNEGENGAGDNVKLEYVNDQPVFIRTTMEAETVRTWVINPERINAEFDRRGAISSKSLDDFVLGIAYAKDFETVKWLFDPVSSMTAPNGYGYVINGKMFGDPTITAATIAELGYGFPDTMTVKGLSGSPKVTKYVFKKVTHQLDSSGYFMNFEAVDLFSISPLGVM